MLRVGLTGGIGAGKSEVSRRLEALGAVVVDADLLAREVVEPGTPGLAAVVGEFGPGVLRPDGSLDREALAALVFADPERRERLNAIVHPLVGQRMAELVSATERERPDAVLVYDVPLLVESGLGGGFDVVVVVDAPDDVRVRRLTEQRDMTEQDVRARMAAQADRAQRRAAADHVIDNDGDLAHLDAQVRRLWADLTARTQPRSPG